METDRTDVVKLLREGLPYSEIAARTGVSRDVVTYVAKQNGLMRRPRLTAEERASVGPRYLAGEHPHLIARDLGIYPRTAYRILQELGVPVEKARHRRRLTQDKIAEVLRRHAAGEDDNTIAREMGTTVQIVRSTIRKADPDWRSDPWLEPKSGYMYQLISPASPYGAMGKTVTGDKRAVQQHRIVMAEALGRPLLRSETVHHINGIRHDNRLENLQLRQGAHGQGSRFTCNACGSHDVSAKPLH